MHTANKFTCWYPSLTFLRAFVIFGCPQDGFLLLFEGSVEGRDKLTQWIFSLIGCVFQTHFIYSTWNLEAHLLLRSGGLRIWPGGRLDSNWDWNWCFLKFIFECHLNHVEGSALLRFHWWAKRLMKSNWKG